MSNTTPRTGAGAGRGAELRAATMTPQTHISAVRRDQYAEAICPRCGHVNLVLAHEFSPRITHCDTEDGGCDQPFIVRVSVQPQQAVTQTCVSLDDFEPIWHGLAHLHPFAAIWQAAMTLANNLAAQVSDRYNADDRTDEAVAAGEVARQIRNWVQPGGVLGQLLREAGMPDAYIAQMPVELRDDQPSVTTGPITDPVVIEGIFKRDAEAMPCR